MQDVNCVFPFLSNFRGEQIFCDMHLVSYSIEAQTNAGMADCTLSSILKDFLQLTRSVKIPKIKNVMVIHFTRIVT